MDSTVNAGLRAIERCDSLGARPYSEATDFLERPFLTEAHRHALEAVRGWMEAAGLSTRIDPIGNLVGRSDAAPDAPTLVIGSHIDSVRNAGRYDGPLGVMIGIECAEALSRRASPPPFAIEVIAFGDEEGSRFPVSMMGSRALTAPLPAECLELKDAAGTTVRQALAAFGLDPDTVPSAARRPGQIIAYVEPHIEQGPVLEASGLPVGVVSGIAGQLRLIVRFSGTAGHAGTTPMRLRRDALAAAAEAILAIEAVCARGPADLVGTVGRVLTSSLAFNVIVGGAEIGVDIRAATDPVRDAAADEVRQAVAAIAARRSLDVTIETAQRLPASPCDPRLVAHMTEAVRSVGVEPVTLVSGAGHDAMTMAALAPTAMLFIRCAGGISHNPAESATAADADIACRALTAFIERLAEDFR
ncbi:MAG TPA: allantoate amidohydrolase [Caulobacteraceae bacterium]|jgi:allantoate deiminase